jgi:hypothetical protein
MPTRELQEQIRQLESDRDEAAMLSFFDDLGKIKKRLKAMNLILKGKLASFDAEQNMGIASEETNATAKRRKEEVGGWWVVRMGVGGVQLPGARPIE